MIEVRIHGRGGQGNVVAAYLLAAAAIEGGRHAQAFPAFGAERRGAPVAAFVRVDGRPIRRRDRVRNPGFVIVQDATLLADPATLEGLAPQGRVLVNSVRAREMPPAAGIPACRWAAVPATRIAETQLGRPIPNTALLGAFLSLTGLVPLEALERALRARFPEDTARRNVLAARAAAEAVPAGAWQEVEEDAARARGL